MATINQTFPVLDERTKLEAGLRVRSTQASWRSLKPIMNALGDSGDVDVSKVAWARTDDHPSGAKVWTVGRDLGDNGYVAIPPAIQETFSSFEGFLMVKVVTRHSRRHYAVPARYGDRELYGYDRALTNGRRTNADGTPGDWVYSLPFHGLVPTSEREGRRFAFFFVITVTGEDDKFVDITVDKVTVTRGREHFRVGVEPHWKTTGSVRADRLPQDDEIMDLPIALAVGEFLANRQRLPETDPDALRNMERAETAANHAASFAAIVNGGK